MINGEQMKVLRKHSGVVPPASFSYEPSIDQFVYRFDINAYVDEVLKKIDFLIERETERRIVGILRERGYYILDQKGRLGE